jgi:hypothetical protein
VTLETPNSSAAREYEKLSFNYQFNVSCDLCPAKIMALNLLKAIRNASALPV